jgi:serine/threonine-protein kinase
MDAIVLKALVKDPNYRYQSADEMRIDIEACLDGQPVAATAAMGSVGYGAYPDDQPTTALRSTDAGATSMLPPMNPDDPGYGGYDDRPDRRRQQKKNNTSTILLVVAAVLVLIGAILIGKWAFSGNNSADDKVAVPTFIGETEETARGMATNSDLKVSITKKTCEDQPKGNVCTQDPKQGTEVEKQSTVNLVVSTGAPKVTVPDVEGIQFEEAKSDLVGKGFKVEQKTEESDRNPGVVIGQDPEGGTEKEKGTTITLTVAKAIAKSTVPDVTGKTCDEAKALMAQSNLTGNCVTDTETEDDNLVDKVISTDPQIGASVDKGSTVKIHLGKKKAEEQVQVPSVTQQTLKDARKALQDLGLSVNVTGSQDDNAIVLTQDQQPGTTVPKGTTVNLTAVAQQNNNGGNNGGGFFGGTTG